MRKLINILEDATKSELLLEVVLFNPIETVLAPHLTELTDENVKKWFLSVFRNWLLKQPNDLYQLPYLPPTANPKQEKAFGFKDLWDVRISSQTATLISHLIDFFNANPNLPRLERMSVENVEHAAEAWIKQMNAKAKREPDDPTQVKVLMQYPNGCTMVELTGANALGKEGERMGHCVGGYCDYVTSGRTRIFSLRDANNMPHATVELHAAGNSVNQIKGRQNRAPVSRYWPMIRQFLESIEATIEHDYKNVGLLQISDDAGERITITQDQFRDMILDPNDERGQKYLNNIDIQTNMDEDTALGLFVSLYGNPRLTNAVVKAAFAWNSSLAIQHVATIGGDKFTPEQLNIALQEIASQDIETNKEFLRLTKPDANVIKTVISAEAQTDRRGRAVSRQNFVLAVAQELPQVYVSILDDDPVFLQAELDSGGQRAAAPFYVYYGTDKISDDMINKAFHYTPREAFKRMRRVNLPLANNQMVAAIGGICAQYDLDAEDIEVLDGLINYLKPDAAVLGDIFPNIIAKSTAILLRIARKYVPDQISQDVTERALININNDSEYKEYFKTEPNPTAYLQQHLFTDIQNRTNQLLQYVQIIDPSLWPLMYAKLRPEAVDPMRTKSIPKKGRDGKPLMKTTNGYQRQETYEMKVKKEPAEYNSEVTKSRRAAQHKFLEALDPLLREPNQTDKELLDETGPKMVAGRYAFIGMDKSPLFDIAIKHLNREAEVSSVGNERGGGWNSGGNGFNAQRMAELSKTMRIKEIAGIINRDYDRETKFGVFMQAAPNRMAEFLKYWYSDKTNNHSGRTVDPWDKFKMPMDKDTAFAALSNVWESNAADGIKDRFATAVLKRFKPSPANLLTMLQTADDVEITRKIMKTTKKPSPELLAWVGEAFPAVIRDTVPISAIPDALLTEFFKSAPKLARALMDRDLRDLGRNYKHGELKFRSQITRDSEVFQKYAMAAKAAGKDAEFEKYTHQAELDDTHDTHDETTIQQNLLHYDKTTLVKIEKKHPEYLPLYFKNFAPKKIAALIDAGLMNYGHHYSYSEAERPHADLSTISPQKLQQVAQAFEPTKTNGEGRSRFIDTILHNKVPLTDDFILSMIPLVNSHSGFGDGTKKILATRIQSDEGKNAVVDIDPHLMNYIKQPTKYMVERLFDTFGKPDSRSEKNKMPYFFKSIIDDWFMQGTKYHNERFYQNTVAAPLLKDEAIRRGGYAIRITKKMFQLLASRRQKQKEETVDHFSNDDDDAI